MRSLTRAGPNGTDLRDLPSQRKMDLMSRLKRILRLCMMVSRSRGPFIFSPW